MQSLARQLEHRVSKTKNMYLTAAGHSKVRQLLPAPVRGEAKAATEGVIGSEMEVSRSIERRWKLGFGGRFTMTLNFALKFLILLW